MSKSAINLFYYITTVTIFPLYFRCNSIYLADQLTAIRNQWNTCCAFLPDSALVPSHSLFYSRTPHTLFDKQREPINNNILTQNTSYRPSDVCSLNFRFVLKPHSKVKNKVCKQYHYSSTTQQPFYRNGEDMPKRCFSSNNMETFKSQSINITGGV